MLEWTMLFLQIILIDIVLSGDNALVIAMASKNLPIGQRKKAIWWGASGAVTLRLTLTIAAVFVLSIPYIQAAGSFLLMWIAIRLLMDDDSHKKIKEAPTLGKAIRTIILADFVMSLDNVLAIAAKAQNNITAIIFGIGLSIPIIIWGSTLVMKLLYKFPVLIYLGAAILGYTAGEMFVKDIKMEFLFVGKEYLHWLIPSVVAAIVICSGLVKRISATRADTQLKL